MYRAYFYEPMQLFHFQDKFFYNCYNFDMIRINIDLLAFILDFRLDINVSQITE